MPNPLPQTIPFGDGGSSARLHARAIELLALATARFIDANAHAAGASIEHAGSFAPRLELSPPVGLSVVAGVPAGERHRRGTESDGPGTPGS